MKVIQLDITPEEMGHNKATEVAPVADGTVIVSVMISQGSAGKPRRFRSHSLAAKLV